MNDSGGTSTPWRAVGGPTPPDSRNALVASPLSLAWPLLLCMVVVSIAASVTLPPYPPLQDFLEWMYQGELVASLLSGGDAGSIRVADYPVPNSATQLILGLLSLMMPSGAAAAVFLLSFMAAAIWVSWALVRRYQPEAAGPLCLLLVVSIFFSAPFWNGYSNYVLGLVLFGAFLLVRDAARVSFWATLTFGLAIFFTHLTIFAAFLALVGLQALASRRVLPAMLGVAPAVVLAFWYYSAMDRGRLDPGEPALGKQAGTVAFEILRHVAYKAYTLAKVGPYHNFVFASGGDAVTRPAVYYGGVLLNGLYASLLVFALGQGARDAVRSRSVQKVPVAAALVLLLMFLFLPANQWVANTGERFLYPALLLLVLFLPLRRGLARALGAAAPLLLVGLAALASPRHDWVAPLPEANWQSPQRALFQHRPTAFVEKWIELERAAAEGDKPRLPLSFETSFLISRELPAPRGRR